MVCPLVFAWSNVKCDIFNDTLDFIDPLYYVRVRFFIQYDINTPNFNLNPLSHLSHINLCYSDWQAPLRAGRPAWIFCSCIHAAPILTSVPAQAASCLVLPTKMRMRTASTPTLKFAATPLPHPTRQMTACTRVLGSKGWGLIKLPHLLPLPRHQPTRPLSAVPTARRSMGTAEVEAEEAWTAWLKTKWRQSTLPYGRWRSWSAAGGRKWWRMEKGSTRACPAVNHPAALCLGKQWNRFSYPISQRWIWHRTATQVQLITLPAGAKIGDKISQKP